MSTPLAMDRLSAAVLGGPSCDVFLAEVGAGGVDISSEDEVLLRELYERIEELHNDRRDGIWPRILSASFAPVFERKFDLIVGNPPWVNWDALSDSYKEATEPLWREAGLYDTYKGDKDDICFLMTRLAMKRYLKEGGRLVF